MYRLIVILYNISQKIWGQVLNYQFSRRGFSPGTEVSDHLRIDKSRRYGKKFASLLDRGEKKGYFYVISCKEFWFGMKQAACLFKLMRLSY
jgi:hypothetical protein